MIVAVDPGEHMGIVLFNPDKTFERVFALHADSYVSIYETVNEALDGVFISEAFIEDQYLKSPRIIALAHNAGIVVACLIAHGCRVFHWRLPKAWKGMVTTAQRRKIIQRRRLFDFTEDEIDAVCMGWTCGLGRFPDDRI